jgi:hypothetical protein
MKARRRATGRELFSRYERPLLKLLDQARVEKSGDYALAELEPLLLKAYQMISGCREQRQLQEAERADKGQILWQVFHPRTKTPLAMSIFDGQKIVTRTPNRRHVEGEYTTIKSQWRPDSSDPWLDLHRELHGYAPKPFDLVRFRQYARDVDECWRRHQERERAKEAA